MIPIMFLMFLRSQISCVFIILSLTLFYLSLDINNVSADDATHTDFTVYCSTNYTKQSDTYSKNYYSDLSTMNYFNYIQNDANLSVSDVEYYKQDWDIHLI